MSEATSGTICKYDCKMDLCNEFVQYNCAVQSCIVMIRYTLDVCIESLDY